MMIRFDDLDALRAQISEEFGEWGPAVTVTQPMIDEFADLTGDHQWIHVDPARASEGPFGATIAHGFLTMALLPRLRPDTTYAVGGEGSRVNYGCDSYRFLAPVPVDSVLRAKSRLADVRAHASGTLLVHEMLVAVEGAERPSLRLTGMLLYKPPTAGSQEP